MNPKTPHLGQHGPHHEPEADRNGQRRAVELRYGKTVAQDRRKLAAHDADDHGAQDPDDEQPVHPGQALDDACAGHTEGLRFRIETVSWSAAQAGKDARAVAIISDSLRSLATTPGHIRSAAAPCHTTAPPQP